ncbi:hypothetical protein D3C74_325480 [compost metagenome]
MTAAAPNARASKLNPTGMDFRFTKVRKPSADPMLFDINQPSKGPAINATAPRIKLSNK